MHALLDQASPLVADEAEATIAKTAAERLRTVAEARQNIKIVVQDDHNIIVPLPARAVELIYLVLTSMAERKPFSVIPHEAELTTQQAADFLNVSRPFLVKMLDEKQIAHRMVGRHRRVKFSDIMAFENESRRAREAAIAAMVEEEIEMGLDD